MFSRHISVIGRRFQFGLSRIASPYPSAMLSGRNYFPELLSAPPVAKRLSSIIARVSPAPLQRGIHCVSGQITHAYIRIHHKVRTRILASYPMRAAGGRIHKVRLVYSGIYLKYDRTRYNETYYNELYYNESHL